ncbi:hypothetical protein [Cryobacterium sp. Y29]|uniref:hypothetical protein n=1 Tax=Cryobacterium sp. Y29 TaxID=2048285 RepID=UPI000CE4BDD6|nr:hypothetical protein [Cryobacterium sp. Y29]
MQNQKQDDAQIDYFLTNMRRLRRDGQLSELMIAELNTRGISWVDFNSSALEYRDAIADRLEELDASEDAVDIKFNHLFISVLQARQWQPFEVAEALVAGEFA